MLYTLASRQVQLRGRHHFVAANATAPAARALLLDTSLQISSFGESPAHELLVTDLGGRVYRIDPA